MKVSRTILYFSIIITSILFSCKEKQTNQSTIKKEINFTKEGELQILDSSTKIVKKQLDIEIADNDFERQTGLMYRKSMKDNQAMLFFMPKEAYQSFYMKNTYIALDIIYIGKNKKIVSIHKNAKPLDENSIPSNAPALYVLEVLAGKSDYWKIEVGDLITWQN